MLQLRQAFRFRSKLRCLIRGIPESLACTATGVVAPLMLVAMSSLAQAPDESIGRIASTLEEMRSAANIARSRKLRRLRLRAAVLTIDQLLEELELLNLQGGSRSLSGWHRRLFSLGRLDPRATRLELSRQKSPEQLMDELFELQERLMRDLAGPEWGSLVDDESANEYAGEVSPKGGRDGSPLRSGLRAS